MTQLKLTFSFTSVFNVSSVFKIIVKFGLLRVVKGDFKIFFYN